jgi:murein L,D-transpeptidase YcbB/YkuD
MLFAVLLFSGCKQKTATIAEKIVVEEPEDLAPTTSDIIRSTLEEIEEKGGQLDSFQLKNSAILKEWYKEENFKTLWTAEGKWLSKGDSLYQLIVAARKHGLFPEHYNCKRLIALHAASKDTAKKENALDASMWAQTDLMLTSAFIQLVKDVKIGRLITDSVIARDTSLNVSFFKKQATVFDESGTDKYIATLEPQHLRYQQLKEALQHFLATADFKNFTYVNARDTLNLRDAVMKRLSEEDSFDMRSSSDTAWLAYRVKSYQQKNNLKSDGKIGPQLIAALNNTDQEKFTQIAITMDRYKQLSPLPAEYIWVNIPSYQLELMKDDEPVLTSKVVVGKSYTRTPVLTSAISDMITYPQWHIPNSIIKKEILPALKRDPGYLARKGYSLSDWKGNIIDPYTVDWSKYKEGIPYRVIQGSGDDNALGVLKFNFPNKYSVYLHDTNQRYLFSQKKRALSHGCVRVESWEDLAYYLLNRDSTAVNAIPIDSVQTWLANKEKHVVPLRKRMPLYIRYFTCSTDDAGKLVFYEDIYGDDRKLREQFFSKTNRL